MNYIDLLNSNYIVFENYGAEGWKPKGYPNLKLALIDPKYNLEWVIVKRVEFDVNDITPG